ncbi:MAG: hypothetical protein V2G42_02570 [bacterium JZ-2024 1]
MRRRAVGMVVALSLMLSFGSCGGGGGGGGTTPAAWSYADLFAQVLAGVRYLSLAADNTGSYHFAFYSQSNGPNYAKSTGTLPTSFTAPTPIEEPAHQNANYGIEATIQVSPDGQPAVAYRYVQPGDPTKYQPGYRTLYSGNWTFSGGFGLGDAGYHPTLVRSRVGSQKDGLFIYANYSNPANGYLAWGSYCNDQTCNVPDTLGTQGLAFSAVAINGATEPVLIFMLTPGNPSSLKMLVCDTMQCQNKQTVTLSTGFGTVSPDSVPTRSLIAGNTVWVIVAAPNIKSGSCTATSSAEIATTCAQPTNWTFADVSADQPTALSLGIHPATNRPVIAYYTGGTVKYAANTGSGWTSPETVVSGLANNSGYPVVRIYQDGSTTKALVIYYDAGMQKIRTATKNL